MYIFLDNINYLGFNFTTSNGKTYEALGTTVKPTQAIKVPVGSGIIARIRVSKCEIGLFGSWGFDFIGDLASIAVTNIAYSGFTDSVLPAGSGDTVTVGSQVVDNRNSSTDQTIQLQTTDAVTQSHSLSVADMWQTGGSISIETEAGLPLIAKSKINTQLNWAVQQTTVSWIPSVRIAQPTKANRPARIDQTRYELRNGHQIRHGQPQVPSREVLRRLLLLHRI